MENAFNAGTPGIYPGLSDLVYHAHPACSNSRLSDFLRSPAHCRARIDNPAPATPAQLLGSACHSAILEPDLFENRYTFLPEDCNLRTNAGKAERDALFAQFGENRVLKYEDYQSALRMRDSVRRHPAARALLEAATMRESSILWKYGELLCKSRIDGWCTEDSILVDVKTTQDASREEFERSLYKFGYHRQAAFYLHACAAVGVPLSDFVIVAVEKTEPYAVGVYRVMDQAVEAGWAQLEPALAHYAECEASGVWPGYGDTIQDITIPAWAFNRIYELED